MKLKDKMPFKVRIEVGEPWDFDIGNGKNSFEGILYKRIKGEDRQNYFIVKVLNPFIWNGVKTNFITISPRHIGYSLSNIFKGNTEDITVGIGRVIDEAITLSDIKTFTFKQVEYFAIGEISLMKNEKNGVTH